MSPRGRLRPDRRLEKELLESHDYVGGLDEVGRGALAGPVSVGLAIVGRRTDDVLPDGLADSKQLTARARTGLVEPVRSWLVDYAVAHASPAEIDERGIVGALRLAGLRALQRVTERGHAPGIVILDGVADWLTAPQADLLTALENGQSAQAAPGPAAEPRIPPVRMEVKADARCAVVAAASVLAKVERDALMIDLTDPGYGWASNKGYASPAHIAGLAELGAGDQHRRSWHLPGLDRH
ncbi:ribonuclease HII [Actinomyces sp. ZJ308]|uniref:ribonuclease HII n=1 Tax=Actinomyces sp. ZJ308 TaxID=2708342 RepID=UPI00141FD56F|nr:ribonuclease HII [Actinomyces sp. ZJ308]